MNTILLNMYPYRFSFHRGVVKIGRKNGWVVSSSQKSYNEMCEMLEKKEIQGAIGSWNTRRNSETYSPPPHQLLDLSFWKQRHSHMQETSIGRMAADHLIDIGFRHTAYYARSPHRFSTPRYHAFRDRCQEYGIHCSPLVGMELISPDLYSPDLMESYPDLSGLAHELMRLPAPLGICAENDIHAQDIIHTCIQFGMSIPEQIGLIGVDNNPICTELSPIALSTLDPHLQQFGEKAALHLLQQLQEGTSLPISFHLPPPVLIPRQSTAVRFSPHPFVQRTLTLIKAQAHDPGFSIETLSQMMQVSRGTLYQHFATGSDISPNGVLTFHRIELAKELLMSSHLSLEEVCDQSGIGSRRHLDLLFKKHLGVTAAAWRKQQRIL